MLLGLIFRTFVIHDWTGVNGYVVAALLFRRRAGT